MKVETGPIASGLLWPNEERGGAFLTGLTWWGVVVIWGAVVGGGTTRRHRQVVNGPAEP